MAMDQVTAPHSVENIDGHRCHAYRIEFKASATQPR